MKKFYSVYDKISQTYNTPFIQNNNAEAMRTFGQLATDEKTTINKHPNDYDLYCVGDWDERNGTTIELTKTMKLANANDFINKEQ